MSSNPETIDLTCDDNDTKRKSKIKQCFMNHRLLRNNISGRRKRKRDYWEDGQMRIKVKLQKRKTTTLLGKKGTTLTPNGVYVNVKVKAFDEKTEKYLVILSLFRTRKW